MSYTALNLDEMDLKRIRLLRGVEPESIRGLLELCTIRKLEPKEILIYPNKPNQTVHFILNGKLRIHLDSVDSKPIAVLGPGESAGEMSVIDRQPASAFVVAEEPCTLLSMDEEILWSLVQSSHIAACNLLFILVQRIRQADSVISGTVETEHQYQQYGVIDALTGLHNRYWLEKMLERQCFRSSTNKTPLSLIMIDIDHFREFNDRYGNRYGNHVLYFIAHKISELLRPTEVIARYGIDEFVVVLPELELATAKRVAQRVHNGVMDNVPIMPDGESIPYPTISIGVAEMVAGQTPEMLLNAADRALYRAKNGGRNCIAE